MNGEGLLRQEIIRSTSRLESLRQQVAEAPTKNGRKAFAKAHKELQTLLSLQTTTTEGIEDESELTNQQDR